jgi:hypothetical protein
LVTRWRNAQERTYFAVSGGVIFIYKHKQKEVFMPFCSKCGKEAANDESFCGKCGNSLQGDGASFLKKLIQNKMAIIVIAVLATGVGVFYAFELFLPRPFDDFAMVSVRGGTFAMKCTGEQGIDCGKNPTHRVTVGKFSIGKFEVTQRQWKLIMGDDNNPSAFKGDDLPVENVSWNDIQEFIKKLNGQTGKSYRLPTEAEWEYAARGGKKGKGYKYSGSNNIDEIAWYFYNNSDDKTQPVGTKQPNELGIHDMSGNVWEWVNDRYGDYTEKTLLSPNGQTSGAYRVFRGGSWFSEAGLCHVSFRSIDLAPDIHFNDVCFRLVLPP